MKNIVWSNFTKIMNDPIKEGPFGKVEDHISSHVWFVLYGCYIIGIYTSEEKAMACIEKYEGAEMKIKKVDANCELDFKLGSPFDI